MRTNPRNDVSVDISNKCTLKCSQCARHQFPNPAKIPGHTWTLEEFKKVISVYSSVDFNGQISDAVLNPNFIEMLKLAYSEGIDVEVSNAASHRDRTWYKNAFSANPDAHWIFGIDGLPDQSSIYRENQDGMHLYSMMLIAKQMGLRVTWQYIVFDYNERQIERAKNLAELNDIELQLNYPTKKRGGKVEDTKKEFQPKCLNGERSTAINATGHVLPCCWMDIPVINPNAEMDDTTRLLFGDKTIFNSSVENIIASDAYQKFMDTVINKSNLSFICEEMCTSSLRNPNRVKVDGRKGISGES